MGKKGDLSDFERGMVVGARRAGLSIQPGTSKVYLIKWPVCVCVCVCVGMFMWFMRTQICIMTWVWHRYYKEKVIYEDIFSVPII